MPAGYREYGRTGGEFVGDGQSGQPLIITAGVILTVWTLPTGGAQVTDLLDGSEDPATTVITDDFGNYRFWAPLEYGTLWVATPLGGDRYAVQPTLIGDDLAGLTTTVTDLAGAVTTAVATAASAATAAADAVVEDLLAEANPFVQYMVAADGTGHRWHVRTAVQGPPAAGDLNEGDFVVIIP